MHHEHSARWSIVARGSSQSEAISTHAVGRHAHDRVDVLGVSAHWAWLAGGYLVAFAVPFVLADVLAINRDLVYGLYAVAVFGLFALWSRSTRYDLVAAVHRLWLAGLLLAAIAWRGMYGVTDGLLLSVFPILVVFAALAGSRLNNRFTGEVVIGVVALAASLAMTAVYHSGYSDFRSDKMAKPVTGDVIWSFPTLLTLNPIGAPIAHAGLHTSAVLHSYETDTFLPPHR